MLLICIQVDKISQADINTEIIFNCQMGRGRTTTGMVIATLVYLNRIGTTGNLVILLEADIFSFLLKYSIPKINQRILVFLRIDFSSWDLQSLMLGN